MKIPNSDNAILQREKIESYLLDRDHPDGASKARLLFTMGYTQRNWSQLEQDIRDQHLGEQVVGSRETSWGIRYDIIAPLVGPTGDVVLFHSVWQIDLGADVPRLITMYPE